MFTAVVLEESSRNLLLERVGVFVPDGYELVAHHMTIKFGAMTPLLKLLEGKILDLEIEGIGISDKCIAVWVGDGGEWSVNEIPHITCAVNRQGGGRPKDSNLIKIYQKIDSFILRGTIQECK